MIPWYVLAWITLGLFAAALATAQHFRNQLNATRQLLLTEHECHVAQRCLAQALQHKLDLVTAVGAEPLLPAVAVRTGLSTGDVRRALDGYRAALDLDREEVLPGEY
jgi:hypothetical protein